MIPRWRSDGEPQALSYGSESVWLAEGPTPLVSPVSLCTSAVEMHSVILRSAALDIKAHMLDGLFQVPAEENPISLHDLVRERQLYRCLILLSTGLGGSRRNELKRRSSHS